MQYLNGSTWVDVNGQSASPATPAPNYNEVTFPPILTRHIRVLVTPTPGFGVGIKEIQVYDYLPNSK